MRERREKKRKVEVKEENHFPLREIGSLFCFFLPYFLARRSTGSRSFFVQGLA